MEAAQVPAVLRTAPGIHACGRPGQEQMGSPTPCWPLCCMPVLAKASREDRLLCPRVRQVEAPLPWPGVHTPELHGDVSLQPLTRG